MSLFKKQAGGFTGKLNSLKFESKDWKSDNGKKYSTLTAALEIEKDGADEAIQQFLPAGFFYPKDGQSISEDGETLEGGAAVGEDSEFARLVQSAIEKGIDADTLLDSDGNGTNFSALVGYRYEFGRQINVEKQMASGRKKLGKKAAATATDEEIMKAGRQQDKKDKTKFYNHNFLVVANVFDKAEEKPTKGKGKTSAKADEKPAKKGKKADAEPDYDAADALLIDLLASAKGNSINKGSLSSVIVRKALEDDMEDEERDAFRELLSSDEFLEREAGWTFDADDKKQPIALATKKAKK